MSTSKENINVYIISHRFPPDRRVTGGHMHAFYLYQQLKKKGVNVKVVSTTPSPHVHKIIRLYWIHFFPVMETFLFSLISCLFILFKTRNIKHQIIINTQGRGIHLVGILMKLVSFRNIKFIMTQHTTEPFFMNELLLQLMQIRKLPNALYLIPGFLTFYIIEKISYNFADEIICVSDKIRQECLYQGVNNKKITVIYNAVLEKKNELNSMGHYYLFMGGNQHIKGFDIMIEAFKTYIKKGGTKFLYICGTDKIKEKHNCIKIIGIVEGSKKDRVFRNCFALIAPSRYDSGPITVLEALAHGKPVILSKNTGLSNYVIRNQFGFSTHLSADEISNTMLYLEGDSILYNEIKTNIIKNFDLYWNKAVDLYIEVYRKALI